MPLSSTTIGSVLPPSPARPLLIWDLDETLIYATREPHRPGDFSVAGYTVYRRPGVDATLAALAPHYDFAVWTVASGAYALMVLRQLFPDPAALRFLWSTTECSRMVDPISGEECWGKDLDRLATEADTDPAAVPVVMVDDRPQRLLGQAPVTVIASPPWRGDLADHYLADLVAPLLAHAAAPDAGHLAALQADADWDGEPPDTDDDDYYDNARDSNGE